METELSKLQLNYLDKQIDEFFVSHCRLSCRYVASKGIRHPGNWLTYFHFFKEVFMKLFFQCMQIKEKILSIVHYKFLRNQNERLNENDANENLYKNPFQAMQNFNENANFSNPIKITLINIH
ncbi:hypothetical protein T05_12976 [Trichinella murrelli]|uniref:Uncharacterized protein n=1 Tax=Trichinella murrelli TaxID=144512 RepID=A0A0V0U2K9_9BILA|nr:hypothetical protein T05_12976 [Trichinella murrelli]